MEHLKQPSRFPSLLSGPDQAAVELGTAKAATGECSKLQRKSFNPFQLADLKVLCPLPKPSWKKRSNLPECGFSGSPTEKPGKIGKTSHPNPPLAPAPLQIRSKSALLAVEPLLALQALQLLGRQLQLRACGSTSPGGGGVAASPKEGGPSFSGAWAPHWNWNKKFT